MMLLKAGTIVKIEGFPVELLFDTEVYTANEELIKQFQAETTAIVSEETIDKTSIVEVNPIASEDVLPTCEEVVIDDIELISEIEAWNRAADEAFEAAMNKFNEDAVAIIDAEIAKEKQNGTLGPTAG